MNNTKHQKIIDFIEAQCEPNELRNLASTLLHLADALDQNWSSKSQSAFRFFDESKRIERNAYNLAIRAKRDLDNRKARSTALPAEIFSEFAWDMLLELFCQHAGGAKVSAKSLTIVANAPQTTALRWIDRLVAMDLVERSASKSDGRVVLVGLTRKGVIAVGQTLERLR